MTESNTTQSRDHELRLLAIELINHGYQIVAIDESNQSVLADICGTRRRIFAEAVQQ